MSITGTIKVLCSCQLESENLIDPGITLSLWWVCGRETESKRFCSPVHKSMINALVWKDKLLREVAFNFIKNYEETILALQTSNWEPARGSYILNWLQRLLSRSRFKSLERWMVIWIINPCIINDSICYMLSLFQ